LKNVIFTQFHFVPFFRNGSIDLLMGDSPILDYYRGTSHGCSLQRIGDTYVEDVYAIGMTKG
jgi:glutamate receptor ionotropic, NMDA 3A